MVGSTVMVSPNQSGGVESISCSLTESMKKYSNHSQTNGNSNSNGSNQIDDNDNHPMITKSLTVNGNGNGNVNVNVNGNENSNSTPDNRDNNCNETGNHEPSIKCSAVHTLERDMPDYDYSDLLEQMRALMLANIADNPGLYSERDCEMCKSNTWFLERYLLRNKMQLDAAVAMLQRAMRYRNESLLASIRAEDFPREFYRIGGVFPYEKDRKGNVMLYIRVKIHKPIKEIQEFLRAYLFFTIERADREANGRGISIVFDCTGAGLANADMGMLSFIIQTLVNYFPKGLSYLLVHELPWLLKPFWHIAKAWLSEEHRQLIKFSNTRTIYEYVDKQNLPDFMGGTCERDYRRAPDHCSDLAQAAKLWGIEQELARTVKAQFDEYLPDDCKDTGCSHTDE